jgi:hypothetical protein
VIDEMNGALNAEQRSAEPADPAQSDLESAETKNVATPPEDEFEGATPPGYDWPTHGGYLGCLMGVMAGVLLGGFLGANIFAAYYNVLDLPLAVYILLNVVLFLALLIGLGRLGWYLGRRYYRYYPQPAGPTWGEADETAMNGDTQEPVAHETHAAPDESEATEQRPA